jgi:hypothetical protein
VEKRAKHTDGESPVADEEEKKLLSAKKDSI